MIQQVKLKVVFLQETKLDSVSTPLVAEFLGKNCNSYAYLAVDETRGGILVAWDQDLVSAKTPIMQDFSISIKLTLKMNNVKFWLTALYGPTTSGAKASYLNELISCQPTPNIPWLCIRDYNLICDASDKNDANINRKEMRYFRQALDASDLMEIRLLNRKYTWSNRRLRPTLVHLDKAFCNRAWDDIFPPLSLLALSSSLSDHCPLLLCNHQLPPRRATFRFEQFWTRSSDFSEVIRAA